MQCEKNGVTRVTFFNVNGDGNWAKWTLKFLYAVNNSSSAPAELIARSIAVIKLIARNIAVIWMQWRMQHSVLQGIMTNPPQNFIEIDFWKPSAPPPEKIHSPLFTDPPPKYSNTASPPLLANIEKLTLISYMITINMVNCKCRFVFLRLWCSVRFLMQIRFFWFDLWSELLLLKVELTELLNLFELLKLNHWTYLDQ